MRIVIASVLFICCCGFAAAANSTVYSIVDAVNAELPPNEQVSPFWWGPFKLERLHQTYRRLYPDGGLLRREGKLFAMMWLCLVVSAGLFHFGFIGVAWLATCGGFLVWFTYFRRPRSKNSATQQIVGRERRERVTKGAKG
jgi:hypothetical protein